MQNQTLRRNTIILSAFPSTSGKEVSYSNIYASVCEHYPDHAAVNGGIAHLLALGYIEQTNNGYARTRPSRSIERKMPRSQSTQREAVQR